MFFKFFWEKMYDVIIIELTIFFKLYLLSRNIEKITAKYLHSLEKE